MRAVVILLAMLVAGESAVAWGKGWRASSVVVRDYAGPDWKDAIRQTVDAYNAAMPRGVPRLRYEDWGTSDCQRVKPKRIQGAIAFCGRAELRYRAITGNRFLGQYLKRSKIILRDPAPEDARRIICHELMHALTDIDDAPNTRDDSCVLGVLAEPGAFDVAYAQRLYRKGHRR